MDFNNVKYQINFVSQVIFRIDFLEMIPSEEIFHESVIFEITKNFSRKEMDQVIKFNYMNVNAPIDDSLPSVSARSVDGIQKTYTSIDGKNKVILSNKFLIAEFNKYIDFDDFFNKVKNVITAIYRKRRITSERTGLRYINLFDPNEMRVSKNLFIQPVASSLSPVVASENEEIVPIRSMHLAEFSSGNLIINFRFGLYNKSYPSKITSGDFVLDYDCFTNEGFQNSEDILRCIDLSHKRIQYLFENSITDKLRSVMNNG